MTRNVLRHFCLVIVGTKPLTAPSRKSSNNIVMREGIHEQKAQGGSITDTEGARKKEGLGRNLFVEAIKTRNRKATLHFLFQFLVVDFLSKERGDEERRGERRVRRMETTKLLITDDETTTQFQLLRSTKMSEVYGAWAAGRGVDQKKWRFLWDGIRVGIDATPGLLGLQDGDNLFAVLEQEGGVTGSGGRVRMPHNNRVSSSMSLKTNDMWSKTIGYDPYAADGAGSSSSSSGGGMATDESMERAKGIMALAKISSAEQGNSDRSTNFAKQVFWGLKRKAPPKGYEMVALSDENSDDDSTEDSSSSGSSSEEEEEAGGAASHSSEDARNIRNTNDDYVSKEEKKQREGEDRDRKHQRKKEKKARRKLEKAAKKKKKKEKKARKRADRKDRKRRKRNDSSDDEGDERKQKKQKKFKK